MGVTLQQISEAGFDDRPVGGGAGLSVDCAPGDDGAIVTVDLPQPLNVMHVRCAVDPSGLTGGRVVVMLGEAAAGDEAWRLTYDADDERFTLTAGDATIGCDVLNALGWQTIEWRIDTAAQTVTLRRNGIEAASATGAAGLAATARLHAGATMKDAPTVGTLRLDEWVIADASVGPVLVEPTGEHADEPARWLVVFNAVDDDSIGWAAHYRAARGLPLANLCGLDLPTGEAIDEPTCDAMVAAIEQYVSDNGLAGRIMGVLLGHGVPGRYTRAGGLVDPVACALQRRDGTTGEVVNPLASDEQPTRPTIANLNGDWLAGRIDGPTLADSVALVDRATAIRHAAPLDGAASTLWADLESGGGAMTAIEALLRGWSESLDRQATRLPMTTSDDGPIETITDDGFYWGFGDEQPGATFGEPAGTRVLAHPLVATAATGLTLRDGDDPNWAPRAIAAGYAAAPASTRPISPTAFAPAGHFFKSLRAGWALGEAWHAATPLLRAGAVLVGDPLMTVALPRRGWNVHGPFASCADVTFDQPLAMLRDDQRTFAVPEAAMPGAGESAIVVVHRVDDFGREHRAFNAAVVESSGGDG